MTREELHAQAEHNMKQNGPLGEAWLYIYEKTGPAYAAKSRGWVHGQLCIASNDPKVSSVKRKFYGEIADLLD